MNNSLCWAYGPTGLVPACTVFQMLHQCSFTEHRFTTLRLICTKVLSKYRRSNHNSQVKGNVKQLSPAAKAQARPCRSWTAENLLPVSLTVMARQSRIKTMISVRSQEVPAVPACETFPLAFVDPKVLPQDVPRLICATGDAGSGRAW